MRRSIALLTALLLPALLGVAAVPAVAAPAPAAVAVVDVLELINSYPGFKTAKDALEARVKQAEAAFEAAKAQIKADEQDLAIKHPQASPTRGAAERLLASKKLNSEFTWKWDVRVAQDEYMAKLIRVHGEVKGHISNYAKVNGIGLVLQMTKEEVTGKSPDELIPNIVVRTVVYFADSLDITGAVKAQFAAAPPAPTPAPAPAPAPAPVPAVR